MSNLPICKKHPKVEDAYILVFSEAHGEVLADIFANIGGPTKDSRRKLTDEIGVALREVKLCYVSHGIRRDDHDGVITFNKVKE